MSRLHHRRSGFTLLEMMLVLGVLAAFAGMTVPSALRMFGQEKLTRSAEQVRGIAAGARVRSIETGLTYQFCCEPGGRHFVVVPFEKQFESDRLNAKGSGQTEGVGRFSRVAGQLPSGIVFGATNLAGSINLTTPAVAQKLAPGALDGLPNAGDLANCNWSAPILFNSDGSASSDAEVTVSDSRKQQITLRFRAVTGSVSMGRIVEGKR
jgi:prepilin-type N-terminal cleavage/methylation domain-containing protein